MSQEELVEDLAEELADYYVGEDAAGLIFKIPHTHHWKFLRRLIARTLQAVADGMPLPDEYYRGKGVTVSQIEATKALYDRRGIHDDIDKWVAEGRKEALLDLLDIAHPVIALRKKGTGKEEER